MGMSTLQSYKGAQIFEAVGLNDEVIEKCFVGTASRIKGVGLEVLAKEALRRHEIGFPTRAEQRLPVLPNFGEFHWRAEGGRDMWGPPTLPDLQVAGPGNSADAHFRVSQHANRNQTPKRASLCLLEI